MAKSASILACQGAVAGFTLVAALAFSGAFAQDPAAIHVLGREPIGEAELYGQNGKPRLPTHELALTLVYFSEGSWQRGAITAALGAAAGILAQCRVVLQRAELVLVEAPARYQYFSTPISRELARAVPGARPAIYFVTDTRQEPAFDAEAIGRANSRTRPELADTVWITHAARDPGISLAHEIAHVLQDDGAHLEDPGNLMRADTAPENTRLNALQCSRLRDTATRNGLLRPIVPSSHKTDPSQSLEDAQQVVEIVGPHAKIGTRRQASRDGADGSGLQQPGAARDDDLIGIRQPVGSALGALGSV